MTTTIMDLKLEQQAEIDRHIKDHNWNRLLEIAEVMAEQDEEAASELRKKALDIKITLDDVEGIISGLELYLNSDNQILTEEAEDYLREALTNFINTQFGI